MAEITAPATQESAQEPVQEAEARPSIAEALVEEWKLTPERAVLFDLLAQWLGRRPDQPLMMTLRNDLGGLLADDLLAANLRYRIAQAESAEEEERRIQRRPPPPPIVYPEPPLVAERLRGEYGLSDTHVELLSLTARYFHFRRLNEALFVDALQAIAGAVWAGDDLLIQALRKRLNLPPA
jgi:hypothetical protein